MLSIIGKQRAAVFTRKKNFEDVEAKLNTPT